MELYPAIDLRRGRCVRLHQGDFDRQTTYDADPLVVARRYEEGGAPWVHVVDLDASRRDGTNRDVVTAIAGAVSVPVQTGGGVRDGSLLDAGLSRIVLGSLAMAEPDRAEEIIVRHPGRVAVGLDHRDGEVRVRGWEDSSGVAVEDAAAWPQLQGAAAFVVTNIKRDGTLEGPDLEGLARLAGRSAVPVVASGGVSGLDDLRALRDVGVVGVIVGKALYEGRFTVEEAVAACAA